MSSADEILTDGVKFLEMFIFRSLTRLLRFCAFCSCVYLRNTGFRRVLCPEDICSSIVFAKISVVKKVSLTKGCVFIVKLLFVFRQNSHLSRCDLTTKPHSERAESERLQHNGRGQKETSVLCVALSLSFV